MGRSEVRYVWIDDVHHVQYWRLYSIAMNWSSFVGKLHNDLLYGFRLYISVSGLFCCRRAAISGCIALLRLNWLGSRASTLQRLGPRP